MDKVKDDNYYKIQLERHAKEFAEIVEEAINKEYSPFFDINCGYGAKTEENRKDQLSFPILIKHTTMSIDIKLTGLTYRKEIL